MRNSTKGNLAISLVFHGIVVALLTFLAAREGMFGAKLKTIAVTMIPKQKPPEPPKEKPPEEPPKIETPQTPKPVQQAVLKPVVAPPPSQAAPPPVAAAPAPLELPAFDFAGG